MPSPIVTCVGGLRPPPLAKRNARGGGLCPPPSLQPARRRAMPTPAGTWIGGLCPPPLANHTVRGGGLRTPSQPSSKNKTEEGDAHPHCYVWGGPADPPRKPKCQWRRARPFTVHGKSKRRRAMPTSIATCVGGLCPPPLAKHNAWGGGLCPPPFLQPARGRAMPTPTCMWTGGLYPPPLANHTVCGGGLRPPPTPSPNNQHGGGLCPPPLLRVGRHCPHHS